MTFAGVSFVVDPEGTVTARGCRGRGSTVRGRGGEDEAGT